jgi:hypothetical protein
MDVHCTCGLFDKTNSEPRRLLVRWLVGAQNKINESLYHHDQNFEVKVAIAVGEFRVSLFILFYFFVHLGLINNRDPGKMG